MEFFDSSKFDGDNVVLTTANICAGGCEMEGLCEHQQSCSKCGNGFGCAPDPCGSHSALLDYSIEEYGLIWTDLAKV